MTHKITDECIRKDSATNIQRFHGQPPPNGHNNQVEVSI